MRCCVRRVAVAVPGLSRDVVVHQRHSDLALHSKLTLEASSGEFTQPVGTAAVLAGAVVAATAARPRHQTVIELGAGCGAVGLAAAHAGARVALTDREPMVLALLRRAVADPANAGPIAESGGSIAITALDWDDPSNASRAIDAATSATPTDRSAAPLLVCGSDVSYDPASLPMLVTMIARLFDAASAPGSEAVLSVSRVRNKTLDGRLRELIADAGLVIQVSTPLYSQGSNPISDQDAIDLLWLRPAPDLRSAIR